MTDDFLSRWSRRKRDVAAGVEEPAKPQAPQDGDETTQVAAASSKVETGDQPAFDLSKLPSLDSIGPGTDMRIFMQPGVPAALSRAALRRAWSADPAIRDFIGLSENSWDFTVPNSMTGFGELDPGEAARLLASAFGDGTEPPPMPEGEIAKAIPSPDQITESSSEMRTAAVEDVNEPPVEDTDRLARAPQENLLQREVNHVASQQDDVPSVKTMTSIRRAHGRALPE